MSDTKPMTRRQLAGLRTADILRARDPDHYKKMGAKGGMVSGPGGFGSIPGLARNVGKIGGQRSKRGPAKKRQL